MLFAGFNAHALIVGPYTADANTLHLWHMDASAAPVPDAVVSGGVNLAGLLNGATLNNASYSGFGSALNTASTRRFRLPPWAIVSGTQPGGSWPGRTVGS